ncbi:CDP-alcohol phosphatidyltransferase family protein [Nocardiopsis sp. HNM0947]|uniref:CDP-alcohol phosphatidyltransferase family protein n=1 Tax=Nocardiopsis coralli TaxID=2772213 RepID=A0ABR9PEB2_9ACTN|nr:CDP-alcohol phosphatidyltransferase family protein [Nocardiopsis coralli]MBE3002162.1 CDP-alcohol phosphatidyltransferase family protein [Nocardiopsis coralli]
MTPTENAVDPDAEAPPPAETDDAPRLRLGVADYLTLGNALCGFLAVWALAMAQAGHLAAGAEGSLPRAAVATAGALLLTASALDVLDGRIARRFGGSGMGAELDNLADVISFGFAPAFFVVTWGVLSGGMNVLPVLAGGAVLTAAIVRLARFSCQAPGTDYFTGLPSPFGAMAIVTVVLLDPPVYGGLAAVLLISWLMVSRMEYPKPRGKRIYAVLGAIGVAVALLAAWALGVPAGDVLIYLMSALVLLFIVTIPFYVLAVRRANAA